MKPHLLNITVEDGKYTLVMPHAGPLHALRYGEEWRDLTGDNFVLSLGQEIERLRTALKEITEWEAESAYDSERKLEAVIRLARQALHPTE